VDTGGTVGCCLGVEITGAEIVCAASSRRELEERTLRERGVLLRTTGERCVLRRVGRAGLGFARMVLGGASARTTFRALGAAAASLVGVERRGWSTAPLTPSRTAANAAAVAAQVSSGRSGRVRRRRGAVRAGPENPSSEVQKRIPPYRLAAT
jgi:hypothetical protein